MMREGVTLQHTLGVQNGGGGGEIQMAQGDASSDPSLAQL